MDADGRRGLGNAGETLAARALVGAGLSIVARNWRCAAGEIDIIAHDQAPDFSADGELATWLVFVEVRTRRGQAFGTALQSITPRKEAKMRQVAEEYVQTHGWAGPWRIDVLAVQMDAAGHLHSVEHVRNAVTG